MGRIMVEYEKVRQEGEVAVRLDFREWMNFKSYAGENFRRAV